MRNFLLTTTFCCSALSLLLNTNNHLSFAPVIYEKALGDATARGKKCSDFSYVPSALEAAFVKNEQWTKKPTLFCEKLKDSTGPWLDQVAGRSPVETNGQIFSHICKRGLDVQLIEPLAGILRDPRMFCDRSKSTLMSVNHISLADKSLLQGGKNILFDAGGTHFSDAMKYFTDVYEERGIIWDEIYVWEASLQSETKYWAGVSQEDQAKWRSKLRFYNGVPVQATRGHPDNVVERIFHDCKPQDFCAFKLDIDTPSVEYSLIMQLLEQSEATSAKLDEFFFEHHVYGVMQKSWGHNVNGTFADSYRIFTKLRELGVRAHSWV